ncbi:MAG: glycosyltransferase family 2 protein [Cyclobacteriaceae bacterium]
MRKFQVAVILINYNSSQYTLDCINSIRSQTSVRYQIVVIDNNSRSSEFEKLSALDEYNEVTLIRSKLNVGFSGANMMGVQVADADYYFFLNNDTIVLNDCISVLVSFMESHPQVANCTGEMFNGKNKHEYSFQYFPTLSVRLLGTGILKRLSPERFPDKRKHYEEPIRVDLVSGSAMFIRARHFEEIGGFDTNFFLYCEEEDIALRLSRQGYYTYLVPKARYQHFESKSSASDSSIRLPYLQEFYISSLYYYAKNYSMPYRMAIQFLYFFKLIRKFYKNVAYVRLAFFVAGGANMKHSLRFKQKIGEH